MGGKHAMPPLRPRQEIVPASRIARPLNAYNEMPRLPSRHWKAVLTSAQSIGFPALTSITLLGPGISSTN
ncbi:hypothetical protein GCM10007981_11160 [Thermocladium modestius]|uniref:Uncharacterized protein n=1 Tax=Thermocladium modestius TaxID=62609 RepID=A0A830GVA5_9CREN|nr:hypothetical protein GCM10007981_11160 [Thermocladium modestius]